MTKEECLKALQGYKDLFELHQIDYYVPEKRRKKFLNNFKCIENLIDEHFDNPPLFLSDLEDEETYWHMDYGWIRIKNVLSYDCIIISTLTSDGYMRISFEEDMFYRKQVEDE